MNRKKFEKLKSDKFCTGKQIFKLLQFSLYRSTVKETVILKQWRYIAEINLTTVTILRRMFSFKVTVI